MPHAVSAWVVASNSNLIEISRRTGFVCPKAAEATGRGLCLAFVTCPAKDWRELLGRRSLQRRLPTAARCGDPQGREFQRSAASLAAVSEQQSKSCFV